MNSNSDCKLTLTLRWKGNSLSREYLDNFETIVDRLVKRRRNRRPGVPSAGDAPGRRYFESYSIILPLADADATSDEIIDAVREIGIRRGVHVTLEKRSGKGESEAVAERLILPNRVSGWKSRVPSRVVSPASDVFPARIKYLEQLATKYYGIGGGDVASIFRNRVQLDAFIDKLTTADINKMSVAYHRIASQNDHEWIVDWVTDPAASGVSANQAMAIYLIALFDRLQDGGLDLKKESNVSKLVDWNRLV